MKQLVIFTLFTFLSFSTLAGDNHKHKERTPEQRLEKLSEKLNLNNEQKTQIAEILKEAHQQRKALGKGEGKSEQHKAIKEDTRQKMSKVLTEDQIKTMEEMHKKRKKKQKDKQ